MNEIEGLSKLEADPWMGAAPPHDPDRPRWINDRSGLNPVRVRQVLRPTNLHELRRIIRRELANHRSVSISGGKTSAAGQCFSAESAHIETGMLSRATEIDAERRVVEVEAGMRWTELDRRLAREGVEFDVQGEENATVGGSVASNLFRGRPVHDLVEKIVLVDPEGTVRTCGPNENRELFDLTLGGFGLVGAIHSVRMRLPEISPALCSKRFGPEDDSGWIPRSTVDSRMTTVFHFDRELEDLPPSMMECLETEGVRGAYTLRRTAGKDQSFLDWGRGAGTSVELVLDFELTPLGVSHLRDQCRDLCTLAQAEGGRMHLGSHRFCGREQLEASHPALESFLTRKLELDPSCVFQNEWWSDLTGIPERP